MTSIKNEKVIANAKQEQNLFILKLVIAEAVMLSKSLKLKNTMTINNCRQPINLIS